MVKRNVRVEANLADRLFNSSEKRLARILLLIARYGKKEKLERVVANNFSGDVSGDDWDYAKPCELFYEQVSQSGPRLFYRKCSKCKYDLVGTKRQTRCASSAEKQAGDNTTTKEVGGKTSMLVGLTHVNKVRYQSRFSLTAHVRSPRGIKQNRDVASRRFPDPPQNFPDDPPVPVSSHRNRFVIPVLRFQQLHAFHHQEPRQGQPVRRMPGDDDLAVQFCRVICVLSTTTMSPPFGLQHMLVGQLLPSKPPRPRQ
jgi:hypothetical protein